MRRPSVTDFVADDAADGCSQCTDAGSNGSRVERAFVVVCWLTHIACYAQQAHLIELPVITSAYSTGRTREVRHCKCYAVLNRAVKGETIVCL
jgi:hypothetical protein